MANKPKQTQGSQKMDRYIEDLVRNRFFVRKMKQLIRNWNKRMAKLPSGMYDTWTEEDKEKDLQFTNELNEIMESYRNLERRIKRFSRDDYLKTKASISENYLLNSEQISYIESLFRDEPVRMQEHFKEVAELDMCHVRDWYDEELMSEATKIDKVASLTGKYETLLNSYPVAIHIHPMASKRDVIDYIDKKWSYIENNYLRGYAEKKLKFGKRKHSQDILDFIWQHRSLTAKQIKKKLDEKYPDNELVYFEITKLIQLEKEKRLGN